MDILLLHPSQFNCADWGGAFPVRHSTVSLWNAWQAAGHRVQYVDLDIDVGRPTYDEPASVERFLAAARTRLGRLTFDVVAISAFTSIHYTATMEVARLCKELNPRCTVVVGGYHALAVPEDFLGPDSPIDLVVQGDGEGALSEILDSKVSMRTSASRVLRSKPFDLAGDQDVDWAAFPYAEYARGEAVFLSVSRGCEFSCSYCLDANGAWRSYSVPSALRMVRRVYDALRPKVILFWEPLFGLHGTWRREFLEHLIALDLDVVYSAMMRLDTITREDINLLSRLRFKVDFGLESGSPAVLSRLMKTSSPERYLARCRDVLSTMSAHGVANLLYLIYNAPGEDRTTLAESLRYVESLRRVTRTTELSPSPYHDFPGSEDARRHSELTRLFGTRFLRPRWWTATAGNLRDGATAIVSATGPGASGFWTTGYTRWGVLRRDFEDALCPAVVQSVVGPYNEHRIAFGGRMVKDLAPALSVGLGVARKVN